MKPRQYVHILLILSEIMIIISLIFYIIAYEQKDWNHLIWIGSKTLSVNKLISDNNKIIYPIYNINSDGSFQIHKYSYKYLLKNSQSPCKKYFKKCGKLDTLGNLMCIPDNDNCPINNVVIDLTDNYNKYIAKEYKMVNLKGLTEGYSLYYTNKETDNNIIAKFKLITNKGEKPRYINEENFILDKDKYQKSNYFNEKKGGGGNGGKGGVIIMEDGVEEEEEVEVEEEVLIVEEVASEI